MLCSEHPNNTILPYSEPPQSVIKRSPRDLHNSGFELSTNHPYNWSSRRKWISISIVSLCSALTYVPFNQCLRCNLKERRPFVSMSLAPSVPQILQSLEEKNKSLGSFSVTVYILGFAVGPLLFGPLSDMYGRATIYRICMTFYLIFSVACALSSSVIMLIGFRFLAGCFGGAPLAIGGAVVSDLYAPGERSQPMAIYSIGPVIGLALGPVVGGILTETLRWRWVFWFASILVWYSEFYFHGEVLNNSRLQCALYQRSWSSRRRMCRLLDAEKTPLEAGWVA